MISNGSKITSSPVAGESPCPPSLQKRIRNGPYGVIIGSKWTRMGPKWDQITVRHASYGVVLRTESSETKRANQHAPVPEGT